jgi:hypothetical protein
VVNKNLFLLPLILFLAGCGSLWGDPKSSGEIPSPGMADSPVTLTPFNPEGTAPTPSKVADQPAMQPAQPTGNDSLWISSSVPDALRQIAMQAGLPLAVDSTSANVHLDLSQGTDFLTSSWIYALVAPFPTTPDGVSLDDLKNTWMGVGTGSFTDRPLWMDGSTLAAFSVLWGDPAPGSVRVSSSDLLVDSTWAERPAWAIVPFELLEPRWKVLLVDGQSPIHKDFNPASYPLKVNFGLQPSAFSLPTDNRDPGKLTVLAMTGTTALVRATADRMERYGVLYPGEEIRTILRAADLTHISNEISFLEGCPTPDPWTGSMQFCSDPRYIALLEDVGTDIVELTGNHLLDYGPEAMLYTLDLYDQLGWSYFGGGHDLTESLKPLLLENNGNKLAFIGCNLVGPPNDWATDDRPGSAPCNFDQLVTDIRSLRSSGYLPVMTFQYNEYYQPNPTDYEQRDFLMMASAGAVIVSGSQAHVPAAMEFSGGSFVHYGLGNLFFDQMSHLMPDGSLMYDTRNVLVDRHVFYNGRYLGTEILTYIIEDYSRPRLMTEPERNELLKKLFRAAGW